MYADTGRVLIFDRIVVADILSVPCILGTKFIEQDIEAILPRRSSGRTTCAALKNCLGKRRVLPA